MLTKAERKTKEIVEKGLAKQPLTDEEIAFVFNLYPYSKEAYYIRWAGQKKSREMSGNLAEVHAQIGLDIGPCPQTCHCCAFSCRTATREQLDKMPLNEVLDYARTFQDGGANLLLLMTTVLYPFDKLLDVCSRVREAIGPDMPLLINTRDMSYEEALEFRRAGINGAYHAARLSEGVQTDLPLQQRIDTMNNLARAGLPLSCCIEPLGVEHTAADFIEKVHIHIAQHPLTSGVGRRVSVPGTQAECCCEMPLAQHAMVTALYRLIDNSTLLTASAHCALLADSGANLCWAEAGYNPRDRANRTERVGIGKSVAQVRKVFTDTGWHVRDGYSQGWNMDRL